MVVPDAAPEGAVVVPESVGEVVVVVGAVEPVPVAVVNGTVLRLTPG